MAGRRGKPRVRRKATAESSEYLEWLDHLTDASKTRTVVVGHKADADVLTKLGVENVYYLQEPYFRFIDLLVSLNRECILLFDANHAGNVACERVGSDLLQHGIKINTRFRKMLFLSANKDLCGLLKFLHKQVMASERRHVAGPPHGLA
ncbi:MAG: hypothetical protein QXT19_01040 [Candidatus Woesearchaeota archaeon]